MTILQAALGGLSAVMTPASMVSAVVTPAISAPNVKRERIKLEGQDDADASESHSAKRSKPDYVVLDD